MVTFREDLPYSVAKERGNKQDKLLMDICFNLKDVSEIDLDEAKKQIDNIDAAK